MRKGFFAVLVAVAAGLGTQVSALAAPALEPMYANGATVFMHAPQKAHGNVSGKNAQDFYLIAYPVMPTNGQAPLCNAALGCPVPPGIPPVHDVVLEGAPGFGNSGTAGAFNPNWHVFALIYNPAWVLSPDFVPAKSTAELDAGEAVGHFIAWPFPTGTDNPFELDTGIVFICVLNSSHA